MCMLRKVASKAFHTYTSERVCQFDNCDNVLSMPTIIYFEFMCKKNLKILRKKDLRHKNKKIKI